MKRYLLFLIGITYFISIFLASYLKDNINLIMTFFMIIIIPAVCWFLKNKLDYKVAVILFFTASFGFFNYFVKNDFYFEKLLSLDGENVTISGKIISYPMNTEKSQVYDIIVDSVSLCNIKKPFKSKLYLKDAGLIAPYTEIKGNVNCFSPYLRADKKLKRYYKSKGQAICFSSFSDKDFVFKDSGKSQNKIKNAFPKMVIYVRKCLKNNLTACYKNNQGSIMIGMLLGDKTNIDYETKRDFSLAGISHLLAVSGLHLTILIQSVFAFLSRINFGRKRATIATIVFIIFFVSLTGFAPSAIRAGIMNIIQLIGVLIDRESDVINSLGLALILILLHDPFLALDIGLRLSFLATLSIILFRQRVYNYIKRFIVKFRSSRFYKIDKLICDSAAVSISAQILTLPVIIFDFARLSILAPVTNIILAPIIQITLIFIAITSLIGGVAFLEILYKVFAALSCVGVYIIKGTASIIASLPFASIPVNKTYINIWLIGTILLIALYKLLLKNNKMKKFVFIYSVIILLLGRLTNDIFNAGVVREERFGSAEENIILSDSKAAILIIRENDKYLINQIEDSMRSVGARKIRELIFDDDIDKSTILRIVSIYEPRKLVCSSEVFELLDNKELKNKYDMTMAKEENNIFIINDDIFVKRKTLVKFLDKENISITNNKGYLRSY